MTWYVASVIMSIRKIDGKQKNISVYENFILIESSTNEEAIAIAQNLAKEEANAASEGLLLNDKPAKMVFEGIRKLVTISNPIDVEQDTVPPRTGTELTYSEYVIKTKNQLKNLVEGKEVNLKYIS